MTSYNSLSDYSLSPTPQAAPAPVPAPSADLSTSKKLAVAAATDEKKAAIGGRTPAPAPVPDPYQLATGAMTGRGSESMGQIESDLRSMDPYSFKLKYGEAGQRLQDEVTTAAGQVHRDATARRSSADVLQDSLIGIPTTGISQVASIANWGIGAIDADVGASVTKNINNAVTGAKSFQSDPLHAAERLNQARTGLSSRDNNALYEKDLTNGESKLVANLRSFGRGVVTGVEDMIESPMTAAQAGIDAVGSLAAGGILTKGLKAAGEAATLGKLTSPGVKVAAELDRATGTLSLARAADATARGASWAAWPTATALLEGGGAFQGTVTDVLNTPVEQLEQTSQSFRDTKAAFIAEGKSEEEAGVLARNEVARSAGLDAAAIQAPAAAVTSLIARKAGESPFKAPSLTGTLREIGQEAVEEFAQSASGQIARNVGLQNNVDPNQALSEDVGSQAITGAVTGALSAGLSKGPGLAVKSTVDAATGAVNAGASAVNAVVKRGQQKLQQESPVNAQVIQNETAALVAQAPQVEAAVIEAIDTLDTPTVTTETKTQAKDYVSSLVQALGFDAAAEKTDHLPARLRESLAKAPNRGMAILEAATAVDDASDPAEQAQAALALYELMEPISRLQEANPGALEELPQDHPIRQEFKRYQQIIEMIGQSPSIVGALTKALSMADAGQINEQLPEVTVETANTPQGQQTIRSTVTAASISPTAVAPEKMAVILKHADDGVITLSPSQRNILQTSLDAINVRKAYLEQVEANGLTQTKDIVSSQIFSANDPLRARDGQPASAIQHMTRIRQAVQSGNTDLAKSRLQDLGKFVTHMRNKVRAITDHFALNDPHAPALPYEALMPDTREFKLSSANGSAKHKGMFANTKSLRSIDLNQSIEAEQTALAGIYNSLVQAFPELGEQEIEPLSLPDALHGKPEDVLKAFAGNQQKKAPTPTPTPTPVKAEAAAATETVTAPQVPETATKAAAEAKPEAAPQTQVEYPDLFDKDKIQTTRQAIEYVFTVSGMDAIGSLKDYSSYLTAFSKDSAVTKVLFHYAESGVIDENKKRNKDEKALFLFDTINNAQSWSDWTMQGGPTVGRIFLAKVAVAPTKTAVVSEDGIGGFAIVDAVIDELSKGNEAVIIENAADFGVAGTQVAIAKKEDALILGSKEDQDSFRAWVKTEAPTEPKKETKQTADELPMRSSSQQYENIRQIDADILAMQGENESRRGYLADPAALASRAEERGLSTAEYTKLLQDNLTNAEERIAELSEYLKTPAAQKLRADEKARSSKISFGSPKAAEPVVESSDVEDAGFIEDVEFIEDAEVVEDAAPAPTGTKALFPNLIRRAENMLDRAFKLIQGEQAPNRIIAQEQSPASLVQEALKNSSSLASLMATTGQSPKHELTQEIAARYQDLLGNDLKGILKAMNASLEKFLTSPYSEKDSRTLGEILMSGGPVNRYIRGKALNILDDAAGKLKYNEFLQQAAALAGIQWYLTANNFQKELSLEDLSDITGLDADAVQSLSTTEIQNLSQGVSLDDAIGNLSGLITQFWGLKSDAASDLAYAQGIPQSVAAEVLQALIKQGLVTKPPSVELGPEHGLSEPRTIDRYVVEALDEKDPLKGYPTAIQDAVMVEPTEVVFLGEDLPPVAKRQMNNPDVANTPEQIQALENEQKTPFHINETMLTVYQALGVDGMLKLFGAGDTSKRVLNETHAKTLEGQNRMVLSSLGSLSSLLDQINNRASALGVEAGEVAVRYAYNFSRVGRMQMLGSFNPQASKLVREAVLPTWTTLDLSERGSEGSQAFFLGLAQALDIKVHKKGVDASVTEVQALLANALAPAVEMLADLDPVDPVLDAGKLQDIFRDAKVPVSALALHALSEYARYKQAEPSDLKAFRTALYVEADGVTNGPINAMVLMSVGKFTAQWVTNVAKGGLSFGSPKTMHELNQLPGGDVDLYGASALATGERLKSLAGVLRRQGHGLSEQAGQLYGMMSLLGMKGVDYDPTRPEGEQLRIDRNIAKNPLTITIYGSSAPGIANKLVGMLSDEVHARMSIAAEAMDKDRKLTFEEALFPGEPEKGRKLARMINDLTTRKVTFNKLRNQYSLEDVPTIDRTPYPVTFRFEPIELGALRDNMLNLFVNPMRDGITEVVGEPLMKAVTQLRRATQAQSIVLEQLYKQGIDDAIAEREKSDPDFREGDFLSKADLAKVLKKLRNIAPTVRAAGQVFMITKSKKIAKERVSVKDGKITREPYNFARALDGTMRTTAQVHAPANAGVAGIPFTTIGFGDGVMMLNLALDTSVQGTLKIFDGMNMPLDKLGDYSRKANKAVSQSWANNPLQAVAETYAKFVENKDQIEAALDREASEITDPAKRLFNQTLVRAVFEDAKKGQVLPTGKIMEQIVLLQKHLDWAANSVEARHKAMADVAYSIDQMAAAGAPHSNSPPGANLAELTTDQIVELLEERYRFHLANPAAAAVPVLVQAPAPVAAATAPASKPTQAPVKTPAPAVLDMTQVGRTDKTSGVRLIGFSALKKLARRSGFSDAQKLILGEILRSMGTKEYTVVSGSAEQIAAYQKARGLTGLNDAGSDSLAGDSRVHGYVSIGERTIYLIDPTPETLVHELVHAATFEAVSAHYQGQGLGENAQVVSDAVQRLEEMMNQFLTLPVDPVTTPIEVQEAIERARSQIENARSPAEALNEFMAWGLTNTQLTSKLKDTKVTSWVQLAKDVFKAIKSLIWGRKKAPAISDDVLSNLQFNAGILVRSQLKISSLVQEATLFHQSNGMSQRLVDLRDALDAKVIALLNGQPNRTLALQAELSDVMDLTADVSDAFAAEFTMDAGERSTFEMVVKALAMRTEVDSSGMARLQELYAHVIKNLDPTSFVPENPVDRQSAEYYSAQKYNLILGKTVRRTDPQGRSTLLPAFLALALVNDEFREVLSKMPLPKTAKNTAGTVDAGLENVGTEWMDWLSRTLSGEGKSKNVAQAIDKLADRITKSALAEQTLINELGSRAQGTSETVNRAMANGLDTLADKTILLNQKLQQGASPKAVKALGSVAETLTRMASEKNGDAVSVGIMDAASRMKLWKPVFDLINEAVGRTLENGPVYDMIKQVRAVAQQLRQEFRDTVPRVIASKFSRTLTDAEWSALYVGLGKTDLAVLMEGSNLQDTLGVLSGNRALNAQIRDLENQIQQSNPTAWSLYQDKMEQLASFMVTGKTKGNLLRNVHAIGRLLGIDKPRGWQLPDATVVKQMDKLVTLYAVRAMSQADRDTVASLVQAESAGVGFALNYLVGQRRAEMEKALQGKALLNHYKGHLPSETRKGVSLTVADDRKAAKLRERGYVRVAGYLGSPLESRRGSLGYYHAPISGRAAFSQGILQNIKQTASGVDQSTGYTSGLVAGRILDRFKVANFARYMNGEPAGMDALLPVYSDAGQVIAFERSVDPTQLQRIKPSSNLADMIGVWRGRQLEEGFAQTTNETLVDRLYQMHRDDIRASASNQSKYINLFSGANDAVVRDAVSLFSDETMEYIRDKFGTEFWVRRDQVDNAIGYRMASVRDLFDEEKSPLSQNAQDNLKKAIVGLTSPAVYRYLVQGEQAVQGFVHSMRENIVIRSMIVPAYNAASNVIQLAMKGVPWNDIGKGTGTKLAEIHGYTQTRLRQIELEAEIRAAGGDPILERRLRTEILSITDGHKRLSIWPLIEAGEFSTVADVGMTAEDLELSSGNLAGFVRKQIEKLPPRLQTAARYGLVSRDTALFAGLQKAVQYGDFVAKAILYDDLVKRRKLSSREALTKVTEAFVNYDFLPGRSRSYLESIGLVWFFSYKIRIAKQALIMMRENPLQALIGTALPLPDGVGTTLEDNVFSKLAEGSLPYSVGPEMAFRGLHMNPWVNLVN